MFLLDLTSTAHTAALTGVQRVSLSLFRALGTRALPITHDPAGGAWRRLVGWERANLDRCLPSGRRAPRWPWPARIGSALRRLRGVAPEAFPPEAGLIVPEVFLPATGSAYPDLFSRLAGPRVAIFHDALALRFPELTAPGTVARCPGYLRELLAFDGIAAVSEASRQSLIEYWRWVGVASTPPVEAIPLGIDPLPTGMPTVAAGGGALPVILCVGTLEGRKNHLALIEACESLWAAGVRFQLRFVGLAHSRTGAGALARLRQLQRSGRDLRYDGPVDDATLHQVYARCAFTVYPSLAEGFGLPVLESLVHGRPCVCSALGAIGESTRMGGCLALERVDSASLAAAIGQLLRDPAALATLATAASARRCQTWSGYAEILLAWMGNLRRRAP